MRLRHAVDLLGLILQVLESGLLTLEDLQIAMDFLEGLWTLNVVLDGIQELLGQIGHLCLARLALLRLRGHGRIGGLRLVALDIRYHLLLLIRQRVLAGGSVGYLLENSVVPLLVRTHKRLCNASLGLRGELALPWLGLAGEM